MCIIVSFVNNDGFVYSFLIFLLVRTSGKMLNSSGDFSVVYHYDICGRLYIFYIRLKKFIRDKVDFKARSITKNKEDAS